MNDLQISMVEDQLVWGNLHPDIWETILLFDTVPISDTTGCEGKKRLRSTPFNRKTVYLAGRFGRIHQRVLNFVLAHWEDSAQLTTDILQLTHINHIDQENLQMPEN